jgi:single stranded DNA-binding protein
MVADELAPATLKCRSGDTPESSQVIDQLASREMLPRNAPSSTAVSQRSAAEECRTRQTADSDASRRFGYSNNTPGDTLPDKYREDENLIKVVGRLSGDPQLNRTPYERPVVTFSLATEESYIDHSGGRQKRTLWYQVKAFGVIAEMAGKYLQKGSRIYVQGRLTTHDWTDRYTGKRRSAEVVVANLRFLDKGLGDIVLRDVLAQAEMTTGYEH